MLKSNWTNKIYKKDTYRANNTKKKRKKKVK